MTRSQERFEDANKSRDKEMMEEVNISIDKEVNEGDAMEMIIEDEDGKNENQQQNEQISNQKQLAPQEPTEDFRTMLSLPYRMILNSVVVFQR